MIARNSCRTPWTNVINIRLEQTLPVIRGQRLSLRGEVFNFANLLNANWGEQAFAFDGGSSFLVSEVGRVNPATGAALAAGTSAADAQSVFSFDPTTSRFNSRNAASNYRMQLSARYSF